MIGPRSLLAGLVLLPGTALAQNGYSFTEAATSTVRYNVATAKPAMACAAVTGLATADTTIISVRVVPAADGVPEHCRVSG